MAIIPVNGFPPEPRSCTATGSDSSSGPGFGPESVPAPCTAAAVSSVPKGVARQVFLRHLQKSIKDPNHDAWVEIFPSKVLMRRELIIAVSRARLSQNPCSIANMILQSSYLTTVQTLVLHIGRKKRLPPYFPLWSRICCSWLRTRQEGTVEGILTDAGLLIIETYNDKDASKDFFRIGQITLAPDVDIVPDLCRTPHDGGMNDLWLNARNQGIWLRGPENFDALVLILARGNKSALARLFEIPGFHINRGDSDKVCAPQQYANSRYQAGTDYEAGEGSTAVLLVDWNYLRPEMEGNITRWDK